MVALAIGLGVILGSKPTADVAAALKGQASLRAHLRRQCDGDWSRVTLDPRGGFKVHNNATSAMDAYAQRLAAMAAPPKAYAEPSQPAPAVIDLRDRPPTRPVQQPPPKRSLRTVVDPAALLSLVSTGGQTKLAEGGVKIVSVPAEERARPPEPVLSDFDLEQSRTYPVDELLSKSAHALLQRFKTGLPMAIRYSHLPEVLALYGVDPQIMDAALRHPDRVDIRPESFDKDKRYPVLGFRRGDMLVILGCRTPITPKVIAAYASALLMHDTHRVDHQGGGGAKRGEKGLPTTARAAAKTLRMLGAEVAVDELSGKPAPVKYRGQEIGSIRTAEHSAKADVQADYQRCLRRMHAIDRKEGRTA